MSRHLDKALEVLEGHHLQRYEDPDGYIDVAPVIAHSMCWRCEAATVDDTLGLCHPCRELLQGDHVAPEPDDGLARWSELFSREDFERRFIYGTDLERALTGELVGIDAEETRLPVAIALAVARDLEVMGPILERAAAAAGVAVHAIIDQVLDLGDALVRIFGLAGLDELVDRLEAGTLLDRLPPVPFKPSRRRFPRRRRRR